LVSKGPWVLLSLDFITNLALTNGKYSIFVVVDRLTKMVHFIPCNIIIIGKETAKLVLDNIYYIHGLPNNIVLDMGTYFTTNFWRGFFSLLGIKINFYKV
jgi:hypothetical protein